MSTNDFKPFAIGGGANVESQGSYITDPALTNGQQPGVASSALNNKALRQGTVIASQLAQAVSDFLGADVFDNGSMPALLGQMKASLLSFPPVVSAYLSGSGTWNAPFVFLAATPSIAPGVGATYTNNGFTFTVVEVNGPGNIFVATANGVPQADGGTLTKTGGTGDATITFYASKGYLYLDVEMAAGGGGGGGGGSGGSNGVTGANSTFGAILTANGGSFGQGDSSPGGTGGTASISSPAFGMALKGGDGSGGSTTGSMGMPGGMNPLGGAGSGQPQGNVGTAGVPNTGAGGGGGSGTGGNIHSSSGGGAGGYIKALIYSPTLGLPTLSYAYSVGAGGSGGAGAGGAFAGGAGGSGIIVVRAFFQ